jgi:hypothetical protein
MDFGRLKCILRTLRRPHKFISGKYKTFVYVSLKMVQRDCAVSRLRTCKPQINTPKEIEVDEAVEILYCNWYKNNVYKAYRRLSCAAEGHVISLVLSRVSFSFYKLFLHLKISGSIQYAQGGSDL